MSLLILLPPSEGKASDVGDGPSFKEWSPEFARDVSRVQTQLKKVAKADRPKWYGVSTPEKAAAAHRLQQAALTSPGMPALSRYTGVVYDFLDAGTLEHPARAEERILIVSGLFGLIPASAPIPDYKLPMNPWLARYWRTINGKRLQAMAEGSTVISLLPAAHAKALDYASLITLDFKLAGGAKSAGHFGKAIKGRFVRFLMENNVRTLAEAADFSEDGYQFNGKDFVQA